MFHYLTPLNSLMTIGNASVVFSVLTLKNWYLLEQSLANEKTLVNLDKSKVLL